MERFCKKTLTAGSCRCLNGSKVCIYYLLTTCTPNVFYTFYPALRFEHLSYHLCYSLFSHFSFFLEKNMLLFFLKFMTQNCGSYVTVQLLQTLNILFENIRNETSLCKYNLYFFMGNLLKQLFNHDFN